MNHVNRPHVFIKELQLYIAYLKNDITDVSIGIITSGQIKKWNSFRNNLSAGIQYYMNLFDNEGQKYKEWGPCTVGSQPYIIAKAQQEE
jgi:hypothetical protein